MDLRAVARFFDTLDFDIFDPGTSTWTLNAFRAQIKMADKFTSIWNRPTRKRVLYSAPGATPTATVIRLSATGQIYMVGTQHHDAIFNAHHRDVTGLHMPSGTAVVTRLVPAGPSNNPGWGVVTAVGTTYGDAELRSVDENQDRQVLSYGHYVLFFPRDFDIRRQDNVVLAGVNHHILETYLDSGYLTARSTVLPDERTNLVYAVVGVPVYDTATQTNVPVTTSYNVTGKFQMLSSSELGDSDVLNETAKVMIHEDFIGVQPKVTDQVTSAGKKYRVMEVSRNAILTEWHLKVKL